MTTWGVLAAIGAAILVALIAVISRLVARACCYRYLGEPRYKRGLHLWERHHGWLVVLAFLPWWPVQVIGILFGLDDLVQHTAQLGVPNSRYSIVHRLAKRWRLI